MGEIMTWYAALTAPFKVLLWVGVVFLGLSILKKLTKLAILVTILIILIFVLRAVVIHLS